MDLLQIITGLLCIGTIVYLVYQIKELYHAFQDSDDFKDFLAQKDYNKERLLKVCDRLTDKNGKIIDQLKSVTDENDRLKKVISNLELENNLLEEENRKLKKKLPSDYWL